MHHDVHAVKSPFQPVAVADVADEVAHGRAGSDRKLLLHLVLLQFVAAKDNELLRPVFLQENFRKLPANEPVPPVTSTVAFCQFMGGA